MRRRLFAFILMSFTAFTGICAGFVKVSRNVNPGLELTGGKTFVYEVTDEDNGSNVDLNEAAKEMQRRLEMAEITYYEIETEGTDQIRVSLAGDSSTLSHAKKLLSYNADFTIATTDDEVNYTYDEFFDSSSKATIEYINQYPIVVFPIIDETKVKLLCEHAQTLGESQNTEEEESSDANETLKYIILWADREEGDDYANAQDENYEGYEDIREKVFLTFPSTVDDLWYDDDHEAIAKTVSYTDDEGNESENPTSAEVKEACQQAKYVCDYFNAGKLDYDVTFKYDVSIDASDSEIITYGARNIQLNWLNGIVIATFVSVILVALWMVSFYKLGSIISGLTVSGSLVATLALYNAIGIEFGAGALIGLLIVAVLGLFTNILIFEKVKNELYKGRTFKKAYTEGQKAASFIVVDASVVAFIASFLCYFIGGRIVQEVGAMVSLGSIINIIIVWLGNKLLLWPLCNDSTLQDKKRILGVNEKLVPDTLKEEKQTFFGNFAEKRPTKAKIVVGSISGAIVLAGAILATVLGVTSGKEIFNYGSTYDSYYRVQVQVVETSNLASSEDLKTQLKNMGYKIEDLKYDEEVNEDDENVIDHFYTIQVKLPSEEEHVEMYTDYLGTVYTMGDDLFMDTLESNTATKLQTIDSEAIIKVTEVTQYQHNIKVWYAGIAVASGIILAAIYIFIRYGFAKGVAAMVTSLLSSLVTLSLFVITRITFTDVAVVALFAVATVALLASLFIFNRDKELALENKDLDKKETMERAVAQSMGPILVLSLVSFFVGFMFLGFGPEVYGVLSFTFGIGSLIAGLLVLVLVGPIYQAIRKNNNYVRKTRKHKKVEPVEKSAEPEEAIFIGIND